MRLKALIWTVLWVGALTFVGCAQTVDLRVSPDVPAATAEAKITKDDNDNTVVEVKAEYLARPQNLTPPKSVYVVWAQAPQGRTINLGQMQVGPDRTGYFRGKTPLQVFRVLVTAEDLPAAPTPSPQVIFSSDVFSARG
jgi:hypothetical protein